MQGICREQRARTTFNLLAVLIDGPKLCELARVKEAAPVRFGCAPLIEIVTRLEGVATSHHLGHRTLQDLRIA